MLISCGMPKFQQGYHCSQLIGSPNFVGNSRCSVEIVAQHAWHVRVEKKEKNMASDKVAF